MPDTKNETLDQTQRGFVTRFVLDGEPEDFRSDAYGEVGASPDGNTMTLPDAPAALKGHLDGTKPGMVSAADWDKVGKEMDKRAEAFLTDFDTKLAEAKGQATTMGKVEKMLPVLDTPGNNPERRVVADQLKSYEFWLGGLKVDIAAETDPAKKAALEQKLVREQGKYLNEMEETLNDWLNRRTELGLPPSAEALAMSDLVQKEHQAMIKDCITKGISPPPLGDMASMTDAELAEVKVIWDDLVNQNGSILIRSDLSNPDAFETGVRSYLETRPSGSTTAITPAEMGIIRDQALADMARLMGAPAGRDLLKQLSASPKKLYFTKGASPECVRSGRALTRSTDPDDPTAGLGAGAGSDCAIALRLSDKDSGLMLRDRDGNPLFTPTHVAMGHEMVHALHSAHGENRASLPTPDTMWNNFEEKWTINKGELSEQTLRNDYGLSAVRYGHRTANPDGSLAVKAEERICKSKELADMVAGGHGISPLDADTFLSVDRRFGAAAVAKMDDAIKLDLIKDADAKGPLPDGWDPSRLSVATIKSIVADKLPYRMKMLGWRAYSLPYSGGAPDPRSGFAHALKTITEARVHHQRSSAGRQFFALGGKAAVDYFATFKTGTGVSLGSWSITDWRANLRLLIAAEGKVKDLIDKTPFVGASAPVLALGARDGLLARMRAVHTAFGTELGGDAGTKGALFADDALTYFKIDATTDRATQVTALEAKQTALMAEAANVDMATGGLDPATLSLVALDKAIMAFKSFGAVKAAEDAFEAVLDAESIKDRGKAYQIALVELEKVNTRLWAITPKAVADALDAVLLEDLRELESDVISLSDLGDVMEKMDEEDAAKAEEIYGAVSPKIRDILNNINANGVFQEYLTSCKLSHVYAFYVAVKGRNTVAIADQCQGSSLIDAGFTQNTIVLLGRDAENASALKAAMDQCYEVMQDKVEDFIRSVTTS